MLRVAGGDVDFDLERLPLDQLFHCFVTDNLLLGLAFLGLFGEEVCDKT